MKASKIAVLFVAVGMTVGCESEEKPAPPKPPNVEAVKKSVEKQMESSKDGPDCETFVKETQAACRDRYEKGLLVDCHEFVTKANTTLNQKSEKVRQSMCGMFGKKLREQVAGATKTGSSPKCLALGKAIDARCISKIGTADYDGQCSGVLITTGRSTTDMADAMCGAQGTFFK